MITIEPRGRDWIVMQDGKSVSVHPSRREAERAVEWLWTNHDIEQDATDQQERR